MGQELSIDVGAWASWAMHGGGAWVVHGVGGWLLIFTAAKYLSYSLYIISMISISLKYLHWVP